MEGKDFYVNNFEDKNVVSEKERLKEQKRKIKQFKKDEKEKAHLAFERERTKHISEMEEMKKIDSQRKKERLEEEKRKKLLAKENRKKAKENNRKKKKISWQKVGRLKTAVICLSVITAITVAALTYTLIAPTDNDMAMNSIYEKSYYDTVNQIDNVDTNLSKAIVTNDSSALQKYLVNTAINCELAENDISQLPLQDESKFYTTKLINQIGDYSKYLNNKIIDGENITVGERQTLIQLYNANLTLKNALQSINESIISGYSFLSLINADNEDVVIKAFNELQNLSVEYPKLIYDGPFSDGADERDVKGLNGSEITNDEGKTKFVEVFGEYGLVDIMSQGESTGTIPTFSYSAEVEGDTLYAQFSKVGGKLMMFAYSGSCQAINYTRDEAEEKATLFLEGQGLTSMKAVWINLTANVYTINFAYTQDDVIIYSDLIKVRVCAETGKVIGFEGTSYYTNHTDRVIGSATITESVAKTKVSTNIEIESSRICIVPIGENSEKLCYEFSGRYNDSLYYVYIDSTNGKQIEMFKVIDSEEGELLI